MRILFICGNGVSSGMIAQRTMKAGIKRGYDVEYDAYSYTSLPEVIDDFDVVMVAPQIAFNEDMIKEICDDHNKKYVLIDTVAYSILDGDKCFTQALNLIEGESK